jgi:hypothetical protein
LAARQTLVDQAPGLCTQREVGIRVGAFGQLTGEGALGALAALDTGLGAMVSCYVKIS